VRPESIAHYRIEEKLGQGGMGEVYRATDTKLGRSVAVKFLPDNMANDVTHMARFTREAQVLASLNHPNIAAIYGVEDRALIMELVEGPSLSDRIKEGPIPLDEALSIARQIADGLEAAHAKGIVHRDLKPANIKFAADGTVKVLDFGLAKVAYASAPLSMDESPTIAATHAGFILGTAGYMAPEQARGRDVDRRADIWAFGVVLYEMLTGTQPFQGETVTDVMAAVVRQDPDLSRVPTKVRPVLRRCLDKDPKRRLRDVGDAMLLLDETMAVSGDAVPAARPKLLGFAIGAAAVAMLALAALAFVHFRETPRPQPTLRFPIDLVSGDLSPIGTNVFAISPDGRNVAVAAFGADGIPRIWLRSLDALSSRVLPNSEIDRASLALFWSPDSRFLAYRSEQQLKRIDITGGPAQTIARVPGNVLGGSWNRDGTILFGTTNAGLMKVAASGGTPTPVTMSDGKEAHAYPQFLPDGRHFLYLRATGPTTRHVFVGSLDAEPGQQDGTPLIQTDYAARYVPGLNGGAGQILFVRDGTLLSQAFDPERRRLSGNPVPVAEQVGANTPNGTAFVSASDTGTLVYFALSDPGIQLTWFTRDGQAAGTAGEPGPYRTIKLSPDGTRVAVVRLDPTNDSDIWLIDLTRNTSTRFTFDPGADVQPAWSPDGSRLAWVARRDDALRFYTKRADGAGGDELLYQFERGDGPSPNLTDWTRDGRFLIYNHESDIWALPITEGTAATRQPVRLVATEGGQLGAYVSPDGRWLAYISNESGRQDIFVQPFAPGAGDTARGPDSMGKWMVSNGTIGMARWRADGRELLFLGTDGGVMSAEITPGAAFTASPAKLLFQLPRPILMQSSTPGSIVDVTRDHQRLLLSIPRAAVGSGYKVVLNWQSDLSPQDE
jgi:Tol biopolymer transport system component